MKREQPKDLSQAGRALRALGVTLLLGLSIVSCGTRQPPLPGDCQEFLDRYFKAVKARDLAALQSLTSAFWSWGSEDLPADDSGKLAEVRNTMIASHYGSIFQEFGDFQSDSVISVKLTRVPEDRPASAVYRAGIHAEIECRARFTKLSPVRVSLHLFKEGQDSEYSLLLWRYQTES